MLQDASVHIPVVLFPSELECRIKRNHSSSKEGERVSRTIFCQKLYGLLIKLLRHLITLVSPATLTRLEFVLRCVEKSVPLVTRDGLIARTSLFVRNVVTCIHRGQWTVGLSCS